MSLIISFLIGLFKNYHIKFSFLKRYFGLFKKILLSSLTLVVSNFANIMFLYTDIMILKLISKTPNTDIADYSFVLNIANILILIPLTMVQVDIEKIKKSVNIKKLNYEIIKFLLIFTFLLTITYYVLVKTIYYDYKGTLYLFLIIVFAKFFQSMSVFHGAIILVNKKFKINLGINVSVLLLNLILSYALYKSFDVLGVAIASLTSLIVRFILLRFFSGYKMYYEK